MVILAAAWAAAQAAATDVNLDYDEGNILWAGTTDLKQSQNYTPQQLVNMGTPAPWWLYAWDICDDEDNFWFVTRYNNEDYNYNYFVIKWNNYNYERAVFRWRVRVDSMKIVHLYRWDGDSWDHIQYNAGGREPPTEYVDVTNYFGSVHLLLLIEGYTPDPGDNDMEADLLDLQVIE